MNGLVFAPETNEPGKLDADEFKREARKFAARHSIPADRVVIFPNDKPRKARREVVADALLRFQQLETVAFFCHGWREGIQAGFGLEHVEELARHIYEATAMAPKLPLYCCSTAQGGSGGDGGFADALRDELVGKRPGAVVDAHDRRGHTSTNPYVRRFVVGKEREKGGQWVIDPTDTRWPAWRKALRDTPLRFDFPMQTTAEIRAGLDK